MSNKNSSISVTGVLATAAWATVIGTIGKFGVDVLGKGHEASVQEPLCDEQMNETRAKLKKFGYEFSEKGSYDTVRSNPKNMSCDEINSAQVSVNSVINVCRASGDEILNSFGLLNAELGITKCDKDDAQDK